ncbi:exosortase X [Hymenobacter radiodurans]|uniref:exosortase X n=1 Tax=Hymenobacter radiodurans TaxID=2496028 RepID=UPI001F109C01|nr:archaeosortase/exosortase family protein [Hymenobacter radiodurans]
MNPLIRFMLIAGSLYLVWLFGYEQYLAIDGRLDAALTQNIATAGAAVLRLFGFEAAVSSDQANLILLSNTPAVKIGYYCDGLVLYALFAGFVLAFPGPIRHKIWFIPMGLILIYSINILRIAALCLNHLYWHQTVDFNHHYTFTFLVYGFIFLLWIWWATRLATKVPVNSTQHVPA